MCSKLVTAVAALAMAATAGVARSADVIETPHPWRLTIMGGLEYLAAPELFSHTLTETGEDVFYEDDNRGGFGDFSLAHRLSDPLMGLTDEIEVYISAGYT